MWRSQCTWTGWNRLLVVRHFICVLPFCSHASPPSSSLFVMFSRGVRSVCLTAVPRLDSHCRGRPRHIADRWITRRDTCSTAGQCPFPRSRKHTHIGTKILIYLTPDWVYISCNRWEFSPQASLVIPINALHGKYPAAVLLSCVMRAGGIGFQGKRASEGHLDPNRLEQNRWITYGVVATDMPTLNILTLYSSFPNRLCRIV